MGLVLVHGESKFLFLELTTAVWRHLEPIQLESDNVGFERLCGIQAFANGKLFAFVVKAIPARVSLRNLHFGQTADPGRPTSYQMDITTGLWESISTAPMKSIDVHYYAELNNIILAFGKQKTQAYNVAQDQWTELGLGLQQAERVISDRGGGRVIGLLGCELRIYDATDNSWLLKLADLPQACVATDVLLAAIQGRVVVLAYSGFFGSYDEDSCEWYEFQEFPRRLNEADFPVVELQGMPQAPLVFAVKSGFGLWKGEIDWQLKAVTWSRQEMPQLHGDINFLACI